MSPSIVVLCGGVSAERDVSLGSGKACALALSRSFPTRLKIVDEETLPDDLDGRREIAFLAFHGGFGEGGGIQRELERRGIAYGGCDAEASARCLDKQRTKETVALAGVRIVPGRAFDAVNKPSVETLEKELGTDVVIKPNADGSSVGLAVCETVEAVRAKLNSIQTGSWLVEKRIHGREVTVGLLRGKAMGVVEVVPRSGVYDFASKYTKGLTEYLAPAPLDEKTTREVQLTAEKAFAACGCRDYARIDFMLSAENELFFLEINTLPGMKDTSLLPMSARCAGLDFTALVRELVTPAWERFRAAASSVSLSA